jgi:peptidoglycan hydrolase-like protein with peptidoglycan-binding domain
VILKDKNVGVGSRPEDIWVVQRLLNYNEYKIPIDGIYNKITDSAVSHFQRNSNLYESHRVDNFTLEKLTEE